MKTDTEKTKKTKVIFRKWKPGAVIAVFPEIPADSTGYAMHSYMHEGQHGACRCPAGLYNELASPAEYSDLYAELEKIGYNLKVIQRATYRHYLARKNVLKKIAGGV
jgi:hypothetical protein